MELGICLLDDYRHSTAADRDRLLLASAKHTAAPEERAMTTFKTHGIVSIMESVSQTRLQSAADRALPLQTRHRVASSVRRLTGRGRAEPARDRSHASGQRRSVSGRRSRVGSAGDGGADVRGRDNPIGQGEAEYEVASDDRHSVFAHVGCFTVWRGESAAEDWRR
ncbi:MAG TPA: hypothetical protein VF578_16650 [Methylomirabilota bacterium]